MPPITSKPYRNTAAHFLSGATVLQLVPELDDGVAARAVIDVAAALSAVGARALVACAGGRLTGELQAKGGIFVPFPARAKNPAVMALNVRRLASLIAAERADIVHARSRALAWVAYGATRLTKTPFVTSFCPASKSSNPISLRYDSVLALGDMVLADSQHSAHAAAKLNSQTAMIRVVRQGLDRRVFAPSAVAPARVQAVRRQWKVTPDERVVLLFHAPGPGSGHEVLIEAAGLLSRSGLCGVKFILAGSGQSKGPLGRDIARAIAREGLRDFVFRARLADVPAALLAASIVVPATGPLDIGGVAAQAQAMGTPVVAANFGAIPEIVLAPPIVPDSLRTGFLVPPGDAAALAIAIARVLMLGAAAASQLSARAMEHAEGSFSVERMCAETLDAYAELWR